MWFLRAQGVGQHEAEDAVQAAFVRLLQSTEEIRRPRAWLRTVALNEHRRSSPGVPGSRRRAVVVPLAPADLAERNAGVAPDPADLSDDATWAADAIARLPGRQRQVMARHVEGWSTSQIADELGMSHAGVRQHVHRARRALRRLRRTTDSDS